MKVPLLDLKPQLEALRAEMLEAVTETLDSTGYILGPTVERFEREVAQYCGTADGIGVSSGTDALLASLMSLEIGHGDLVLTTPYTFFATMGAILRTGADPLFVDIEPEGLNIDPDEVEKALADDAKNGKKIKAVMPVHLYGQCADMKKICAVCEKYQVPVIEDAAQAIGAEYPMDVDGKVEWKKAGAMGLAGCFSFFPSKNLGGIGDGGMVVTSDEAFAAVLRSNRNHGAEPKYYHSRVGGNFRLDTIQASVLSIKLKYLEQWHAARRRNASIYTKLFVEAGLVDDPVRLPRTLYGEIKGAEERNHHIYNQFIIQVPKRDGLRDHLLKNEVGCEIYYPLCLHHQECLQGEKYKKQSFPVAEEAARTSLALPIYPELTAAQLGFVVEKIKEFYQL